MLVPFPWRIAVLTGPFVVLLISAVTAMAAETPTGLRCELLPEPRGVLDDRPEFSWIVPEGRQVAYRIVVAHDDAGERGEIVWDSGRVDSAASVAVSHGGSPLEAGEAYRWRVRLWSGADAGTGWSAWRSFTLADESPAGDGTITTPRRDLVETEVAPVATVAVDGVTFFDFGRAAFGTLRFTADVPQAGTAVIRFGEMKADGPRVERDPPGTVRFREAAITLKPGRRTYRVAVPPDERNTSHPLAILMPARIGEVVPFRYAEITLPDDGRVEDVRQIAVHYPFDETAASFDCSDETLNDVWDLCAYSMKATSFAAVYVDGDRERIPYEADAFINQLGHYAVDREFALARYSHEHLLANPTWPTEWKQHSIMMAHADWMATGDVDSLRANWERLRDVKSLIEYAREDGLLINTGGDNPRRSDDLVDWPQGERDGFVFTPVNAVVNAFHYRNCVQLAEMAEAIGERSDAARFRDRADRVRAAFHDAFYNPKTGLYEDGPGAGHSSQHANFFPLAFGIVPDGRRGPVVEFVKSKRMACSVYAAQYLLDALFDAGEAEHAIAIMTDPATDRSWHHMVYESGSTITTEAWATKYKPNQDWNHAWGAAALNVIVRKLMGIEPLEAGYARVRIRPRPGRLAHARLTTPTIRGPISVMYRVGEPLEVTIPGNVTAEVWPIGAVEPTVVGSGTHRVE